MTEQEQKYLKEAVVNLTIELAEKNLKLKDAEELAGKNWQWYSEEKEKHEALIKQVQDNKETAAQETE